MENANTQNAYKSKRCPLHVTYFANYYRYGKTTDYMTSNLGWWCLATSHYRAVPSANIYKSPTAKPEYQTTSSCYIQHDDSDCKIWWNATATADNVAKCWMLNYTTNTVCKILRRTELIIYGGVVNVVKHTMHKKMYMNVVMYCYLHKNVGYSSD